MSENKKEATVNNKSKSEGRQEDKISFNDWFVISMKANKKIEAHHYDALLTYARKQNLTETEPSSKYDEALKKFGF